MIDARMKFLYSKAKELDCILSKNQPFSVFEAFYKANIVDIDLILHSSALKEMLFSEEYLLKYSRKQLLAVCVHVTLPICCAIIFNKCLPDKTRAFFYNCLNKFTYYDWNLFSQSFYGTDLIRECKNLRKSEHLRYQEHEQNFIELTKAVAKKKKLAQDIEYALKQDSFSIYEIKTFLLGKKIVKTHFLGALTLNAKKVVVAMIKKYKDEIFKWHSPEEWLFIICNNFCNNAGISAMRVIEKIFSGTVKNAKDPWGANLLWNTFFCEPYNTVCSIDDMQKELIRLGCDPDEKNDCGLSFNLVMENTLKKYNKFNE